MTEIAPVSVPVVVSDYTRTHIEGNRVVYVRHTHEGTAEAGTTGGRHMVQEMGYVTYSRNGLQAEKPLPGTIANIWV
jgi:hypothetical protein